MKKKKNILVHFNKPLHRHSVGPDTPDLTFIYGPFKHFAEKHRDVIYYVTSRGYFTSKEQVK